MDEQKNRNLSAEALGAAETAVDEVGKADGGVKAAGDAPRPLWQRVLAWVGVVYVIVAMLLMSYFMARGEQLTNIGWLMLTPVLLAAAVYLPLKYSKGKAKGGMPMLFAGELALMYLLYTAFAKGIPALIAQFS